MRLAGFRFFVARFFGFFLAVLRLAGFRFFVARFLVARFFFVVLRLAGFRFFVARFLVARFLVLRFLAGMRTTSSQNQIDMPKTNSRFPLRKL